MNQKRKSTVLIIGDIMIDRYISGNVNRISPEAPIPVLKYEKEHSVLGGAGNVAANVVALGGRAILVGVVGEGDENNRLLGYILENNSILTFPNILDIVTVEEAGRQTTVKTRYMSGSHQLLRLDKESISPITDYSKDQIIRIIQSSILEADVVILSDYNKGVLQPDLLEKIIDIARKSYKTIIVDPKRKTFKDYKNSHIITPNVQEVFEATGIRVIDNDTAEKAGYKIICDTLADAVIVTRSEKGISIIFRDQLPLHLPTKSQEVTDVSGAGDTLVAGLALMIAEGKNLKEAAAIANIAAGISVGKLGTSAVRRIELDQVLFDRGEAPTKILDMKNALERVTLMKARGKKIGFTNGCFDILHPGHTQLLTKAREACDYLVVGLNSDNSVKRLKGESRPIQNENARASVLASLNAVDLIVIFDEDTPLELITALQPNILIKGADYKNKEVVGSDVVKSNSGKIILIDLEEGHSTTNIVNRIKAVG